MCLRIFEISFVIISLLYVVLATSLIYGAAGIMKPLKASAFVSSIVMVLFLYVINALTLSFCLSGAAKIVMFAFAIMPFVIGKYAEYNNHKLFTYIQNFIIICSMAYVSYMLSF